MKEKRVLILLAIVIIVLVAVLGIVFLYNSKNKTIESKNNIKESTKERTKKENKEEIDSTEEINNSNQEKDRSSTTKNKNSNSTVKNNNSSSTTTTSKENSSEKNNNITNNNSSTQTQQPSPPAQVPQEQPKPKTEWEKLGISEYDYYNTPMIVGEEVVYKGDISLCNAEIDRLVNAYYREGLSGGNSYTVNGKYTYNYIGCGINMFINGVKYKYSQVKTMGYK